MTSEKNIKVYFCPSCKSKEVRYIFGIRNLFGIVPQMRCKKCGFAGMTFPILVVAEEKLKKMNNKFKHKKGRIVIRRHVK
jgi:ribosomal protein L37AE/L43A